MNKFEEDLIAEAKCSCLTAGILKIIVGIAICFAGYYGIKDYAGSGSEALVYDLMVVVGICKIGLTIVDMKDRLGIKYYSEFQYKLKKHNISIDDLERDMKYATAFGKYLLGNKYLLKKGKDLDVISYQDLVWVYLERSKKEYRLWGIIPEREEISYKVIYYDKLQNKKVIEAGSEEEGKKIIHTIQRYAPFLIFGWDKQLNKDNFMQASKFVAQRYETYMKAMEPIRKIATK